MNRWLLNLMRWAVPLGILAYLFYDVSRQDGFASLRIDPGNWYLLVLALGLITAATTVSIARWFMLVRTLGMAFSPLTALRLGFLAELLNFVSVGSVGGDVIKAVFLARDQPGRRAQAVSTVMVDRVVGLYSLFLLASLAILVTGVWRVSPEVRWISRATLLLTVVGTCGLIALVAVRVVGRTLSRLGSALPWVGPTIEQVTGALGHYRRRWPVLLAAVLMSFAVHVLLALSVFLIALALTVDPPSFGAHLVIMPLATTTGVLPLPMSGLGAFEYVLEMLYQQLAAGAARPAGQGLIVALGYRVLSIVMAGGAYFAAQRDVGEVVRQAAAIRDQM